MATEEASGVSDHFRSVTVTAIAALAGIAAALVSWRMTGDAATAAQAAKNQNAQMVMLAAILVQPLMLRLLGLLKDDFGVKDFLFIAFMTFSLWFVSWAILLTSSA